MSFNVVITHANRPFYRIARDSKPIEVLGTYNPVPQKPVGLSDSEAKTARPYKDIALDQIRTKYWLGVGAQPTDGVWRLLSMVCFDPGTILQHSALEARTFFYLDGERGEQLKYHRWIDYGY